MKVDVSTQTTINRSRDAVASYATNPDNAPKWYVHIKSVEWQTTPPAELGSKIALVAQFLGRELTYTDEIVELIEGEKLVMRTAEGPFPMETSYVFEEIEHGKTRMSLRNRGQPAGFSRVLAPVMAQA
ncbi:MAG: SRPBCC family protein, partial [Alphaproteobacteria bacterium]